MSALTVHLRKQGTRPRKQGAVLVPQESLTRVRYPEWRSECNELDVETTDDIDEVECGRCKRTKDYRKRRAIRDETKQEIKDLLGDKS